MLSLIKNAEFKKQLWLELSKARLIALPALMWAIVVLIYLDSDGEFTIAFFEGIYGFSIAAILVLSGAWGTYKVVSSMVNEVNEQTWISQQMTPLSAWQMTLGKLFGATIFTWYGSFLAFILGFIASFQVVEQDMTLSLLLLALLGSFLVQCFAFSLSFLSIRRQQSLHSRKISPFPYVLIAWIAAAYLAIGGIGVLTWSTAYGDSWLETNIPWFGLEFEFQWIALIVMALLGLWATLGIQRMMRQQLQFKNRPFYWWVFLIFMMVLSVGFLYQEPVLDDLQQQALGTTTLFLGVAATGSVLALYGILVLDSKQLIELRKLQYAWQERDVRTALTQTPLWLCTLAFVALMGVLMSIDFMLSDLSLSEQFWPLHSFLFVLRDLFLLLTLVLMGRRRAEAQWVILLIVLYGLVPAILYAAGAGEIGASFLHPNTQANVITLPMTAVQSALAFYWFRSQWSKS